MACNDGFQRLLQNSYKCHLLGKALSSVNIFILFTKQANRNNKHNTVRVGENAYFKVGIMINVPLLITIYLDKIHKLFQRLNTEEKRSTVSSLSRFLIIWKPQFGNYTSKLV